MREKKRLLLLGGSHYLLPVIEAAHERYMLMADRIRLRQELFNSVRRLDILQELLDETVTEITKKVEAATEAE